jgi:DNA-binding Lrp family transcriptional regulator
MNKEEGSNDAFSVFCSDFACDILVATRSKPHSAQELAKYCDASLPTVYRRVNTLVDRGLLEEELEVDPDGDHYKTYTSNLDYVRLEVEETGFVTSISFQRDIADQFGEFWQDLGPKADQNHSS